MKFLNLSIEYVCDLVNKSYTVIKDMKQKALDSEKLIDYLIEMDAEYTRTSTYLHNSKNMCADTVVRNKCSELSEQFSKDMIDLHSYKNLYRALKNYTIPFDYDEKEHYLLERFKTKNLKEMERMGLHLDDDVTDLVKDISKELTELQNSFRKNISDFNKKLIFTKDELDGLPEDWFTEARVVDTNDDPTKITYAVTTKFPDVKPVNLFCVNRDVRRKVYQLFCTRCHEENVPILEQNIAMKNEKAKLLGYKTHADYKTENKVIQNSENAINFLNTMNKMFSENYNKEMETLEKFAFENGFESDKLEAWDTKFYHRMYTEKHTNLDKEELRKKFPLKKVVSGMLEVYQKLLGYRFELQDDNDKFHESVEVYKVYEESSGQEMGTFYLDLFPREGKYSHAAVFPLTMPHINRMTGEKQLPSGMMACNFQDGNLYFSEEVVTLFHEFGHMMHLLSCKPETTKLSYFSPFGCEWDFIETPSQMFEFWCYEKEPLRMMSEGLTDDDIEKIKASKHILPTLHYKGQLTFAMFDMVIHTKDFKTKDINSVKLWTEIEKSIKGRISPNTERVGEFGHIMGGYDAGYYGYLRSETFSANLFYVLFKNNPLDSILDSILGTKFREEFLGAGSVYDATDLMKKALNLNRKPDESERNIDDSWFVKSLG